jgi:hypothetical protein
MPKCVPNLTPGDPSAIWLANSAVALAALASILLLACESKCAPGRVLRNKLCYPADADSGQMDATVDGGVLAASNGTAGTGTKKGGATAAGSSSTPASPTIDPAIHWMCTKNAAGECTSCKQDTDCGTHVCERGYCTDCRDTLQCGAANSCISNRCVPTRKPSSVWLVSGGGQTSAAGLKLQLSVGMPTPVTEAAGGGFKMNAALGAGNF